MYRKIISLVCVLLATSLVPFASAASSSSKSKSEETPKAKATAKIDVNTADAATLETLPGVGPATARAIIAARPFATVDELESVPGIGPSRMAALRDQVRVSHPRTAKAPAKAAPAEKAPSATKDDSARAARNASSTKAAKEERASESSRTASTTPRTAERTTTASPRSERALEPTGYPSSSRQAAAPASSGLVNLNTASREELEALPEIGPVKAQAIIDARPFKTIEDVMKVKGIKEGTFDAIKDRITVR